MKILINIKISYPMMYELFPSDKYLPKPVDECLQIYFNTTYYARTREIICIRSHFSEDILRDWANAFNEDLICRGEPEKCLNEWCKHLNNWLRYQNLNSNPKDLFNVKATSKTNASATGNSDKKGAAYDAIDRLFGNKT